MPLYLHDTNIVHDDLKGVNLPLRIPRTHSTFQYPNFKCQRSADVYTPEFRSSSRVGRALCSNPITKIQLRSALPRHSDDGAFWKMSVASQPAWY